jgi:hypothetical protein
MGNYVIFKNLHNENTHAPDWQIFAQSGHSALHIAGAALIVGLAPGVNPTNIINKL